jgi:hypothetical protein
MDKLLAEFAAIGLAQALPGLRRMRAVAIMGMDAEIAKLEALLAQCGGIVPNGAHAKRGRPPKRESAVIAAARQIEAGRGRTNQWTGMTPEERSIEMKRRVDAKGYWANMTPEERSAEMARRWKKRKTQVATGTGGMRNMPKEARSKLAIGYWYKMTPEERAREMARRVAVRSGKAKPKDPARYARQLAYRKNRAEVQA